ncbi:dihydrodipicolinate synthase family protein [Petrotoga sp. 9PWA.NaAc.5.4]|uniref:dihydrodipicolinate synthase family protein n=1 Tax=Petrotoga sp. 9PWA.NaAc.5.4 TaxID=1434328 RepID=UPI000CA81692|nr:dihydrodipicolinate synthase family protein [Petrotoga sp. 9PWA.NaAc.5.4]PNR95814.1 hypothetical protein X924_04255 [Petrotoga sp. 9PWA.NaAc.5.4]
MLGGIVPAMLTPFNKKGEIDEKVIKDYLNFVEEKKVNGLFIGGTTGEGILLEKEEKRKLFEIVQKYGGDMLNIVAHCGSNNLIQARELIEYAKYYEIDTVGVVVPFFNHYSQKEIFNFYNQLANDFSDIDLFVYNIPSSARNEIDIETMKELFAANSNIRGIKDSSGSLEKIIDFVNISEKIIVMVGADRILIYALISGAKGTVSGPAAIFPELFVRLVEEYNNGQIKEALETQNILVKFSEAVGWGYSIPTLKAAMKIRGFDFGAPRPPFNQLSEREEKDLKLRLEKLCNDYSVPLRI